jgi:hypothetical protein
MARALHSEPLAFRIGLLGGAPRLARAISTAAAIGGWDGGAPGSSMGLACASLFGSHIGLLAEATIGADQRGQGVASHRCGRRWTHRQHQPRAAASRSGFRRTSHRPIPAPEFIAGMPRNADAPWL